MTAQQSEPDLLLNTTGLHRSVTSVWHGRHSHEADSFDNDFVIGRKPIVNATWRQITRFWQRYIQNAKWLSEYLAEMMCGPMRGSDGRVKKVVCAGGLNNDYLKTVEVYDLRSNSWSTGKFCRVSFHSAAKGTNFMQNWNLIMRQKGWFHAHFFMWHMRAGQQHNSWFIFVITIYP